MNIKDYTENLADNIGKELKDKQKALKFDNTPTAGSVNPVTSEGIKEYVDSHSGTTYTAGQNITINNNVISAKDTVYTAGEGININSYNNITNNTLNTTSGTGITITKTVDGNRVTNRFELDLTAGTGIQFTNSNNTKIISNKLKGRVNTNIIDGEYVDTYEFSKSFNNTHGSTGEKVSSAWVDKTWNGLTDFYGDYIWTDGNNIYYSRGFTHYVLDKSTSTWSAKTWTGFTDFSGTNVWTDGENIYYSSLNTHKILDKTTSSWTDKTWIGVSNFYGGNVINFDGHSYMLSASGSSQYYRLNDEKTHWQPLQCNVPLYSPSFIDGDKMYYVDKASTTTGYMYTINFNGEIVGYKKTWDFYPSSITMRTLSYGKIWTDGKEIYYSSTAQWYNGNYVLDKLTSTWYSKTWTGLSEFDGGYVWTDGDNIYYSSGSTQKILTKPETTTIPSTKPSLKNTEELAKVAETGDYNDLINKPSIPATITWLTVHLYNNSAPATQIIFDIATTNPDYLLNATDFEDFVTKFVGSDDDIYFPASGMINNKIIWSIFTYDDDGDYVIGVNTTDSDTISIHSSFTGLSYSVRRKKITF